MTTVLVERPDPHVRVLRMNRPERSNAMSIQFCLEFGRALDEVGRDNACRVVVLTGAGRAFCSGLDLKDRTVLPNVEGLTVPRIGPRAMRVYSEIVPAMRHLPQPILAAVNGAAYGGGFCLALAADLRIAGEAAVFNATGVVNGLTSTELGASWLLPRLVGAAHAGSILLTGRKVEAPEALRMGLVSEVVPDARLFERALELARGMCELSPFGLQMTKQVLWANLEIGSLQAAIDLEDRNQLMLGMTDNLPEAIRAFDEKRKPVYEDEPRRDVYRRE